MRGLMKNYLSDLYVDQENPQLINILWDSFSNGKDGFNGREEEGEDGTGRVLQLAWAVRCDMTLNTIDCWLIDDPVYVPDGASTLLDASKWRLCTDCVYRTINYSAGYGADATPGAFEFVEATEEQVALLEKLEGMTFRRLRGDRNISYGDGGESRLVYPVYATESLGLSRARRVALVDALTRLSEAKNDFQTERPWIKDIVDPDLCPMLTPNWKKVALEDIVERLKDSYYDRDLREEKRDIECGSLPEYVQLRRSYQWIPSSFIISAAGGVNIASKINNLAITSDNEPVYRGLASAFKKMLPALEKLGVVTLGARSELQVVVKCQQYVLEPRTSYSGRWHREGMDERVAAVGVYYACVDEQLTGGSLKFRPDEPPTPGYASTLQRDLEVPVGTGSAVVFSNVLPHRFRALCNPTDSQKRRLFVNFFVLQPRPGKAAVKICANRGELLVLLMKVGLTRDACRVILEHMDPFKHFWPSLPGAKAFRAKVKAGLMATQRGWGYISWGNCGTIKYLPDAQHHRYEVSQPVHTDSGADDVYE